MGGYLYQYDGTASWFCCGEAWGPCGAHGGGSCGDCKSGWKHGALPKVSNTNCDFSGCGMSLPWSECGDIIIVKSLCNYSHVEALIKDCGPAQCALCNMSVACGSCGSNCSALVDLTPRAFSVIADLDLGRIPARVFLQK
jgi:hypothetical protein